MAKNCNGTKPFYKNPNNRVDKSYDKFIKNANLKEVHLTEKELESEKAIDFKLIPTNDKDLNNNIKKTL